MAFVRSLLAWDSISRAATFPRRSLTWWIKTERSASLNIATRATSQRLRQASDDVSEAARSLSI